MVDSDLTEPCTTTIYCLRCFCLQESIQQQSSKLEQQQQKPKNKQMKNGKSNFVAEQNLEMFSCGEISGLEMANSIESWT